MSLKGRVALVTRGGRGIGRAVALGLAGAGADVAVNYRRDEEAARATVAEITRLGTRGVAYQASVDVPADDEAMAEAVLRDFGCVDILVNNAGIASRGQTVVDTDPAELERVWGTRARGDVVMISSVATVAWGPNSSPYNMAKASLEALAWTLAKEERNHGIHVNVVAPGLVETEMGRRLVRGAMGVDDIHTLDRGSPFGHVCRPDEVADVVLFLVSEQAGYLTGQKIVVDGGA